MFDIMSYIKFTFARKISIFNHPGFVLDSQRAFDFTYPLKFGKASALMQKELSLLRASYWNCSTFCKVIFLKYIIEYL